MHAQPPASDAVRGSDLALFRRWPRLRERLPRRPFVVVPTPVEPLAADGLPGGRVFVKRDDRSCPLYGGNKPRKLEFVLGRALERGARRVVTTGAHGSHHALATTILGREAGLATTLVLVPQPTTQEVEQTHALQAAYGAEQVHAGGVASAAIKTLGVLARSWLRGEAPFLISTGGSSPLGNVGFVSAALELAEQVREGVLPAPAEVYVPVGSGGTVAGLVLGFALAELDVTVRGVLVSDILPPSPEGLARAANACARLLHRLHPAVSPPRIDAGRFPLDRSELGPGYGAPTPAAADALRAAADAGLQLDGTYTAKCFAALRARAARGELPDAPVLFWNTHNGIALDPSPSPPPAG